MSTCLATQPATLADFERLHRAMSKGARARTTISGTRDAFAVTWDGVEVLRVAHNRDVFACRVPEGEGGSLALRRLLELVARCYGFGFACNMNAPAVAQRGKGYVFLHLAGHGSFRMLPGLWIVWSRNAPERTRPGTSDSFGLSMALDGLAAKFPPRPIVAGSRR